MCVKTCLVEKQPEHLTMRKGHGMMREQKQNGQGERRKRDMLEPKDFEQISGIIEKHFIQSNIGSNVLKKNLAALERNCMVSKAK